MSDAPEAKQRNAMAPEERAGERPAERRVADRTEPADVEWLDAAELRAGTPEVLQLLAATGC